MPARSAATRQTSTSAASLADAPTHRHTACLQAWRSAGQRALPSATGTGSGHIVEHTKSERHLGQAREYASHPVLPHANRPPATAAASPHRNRSPAAIPQAAALQVKLREDAAAGRTSTPSRHRLTNRSLLEEVFDEVESERVLPEPENRTPADTCKCRCGATPSKSEDDETQS